MILPQSALHIVHCTVVSMLPPASDACSAQTIVPEVYKDYLLGENVIT